MAETRSKCKKHGGVKGLYCYRHNVRLCARCPVHPLCKSEMYCVQDYEKIASRWKETLESNKEKLIQARKENKEVSKSCTEQITLEKERILMEIAKIFDDLLEKVSDERKENDAELRDMLVKTEANMEAIDDVLRETDSTLLAVMKGMETIIKTKTRSKEQQTLKCFTYHEYATSKSKMQKFCGDLKEKTLFVNLHLDDEAQLELTDASEDTGIEDPKTPDTEQRDSQNVGSRNDDSDGPFDSDDDDDLGSTDDDGDVGSTDDDGDGDDDADYTDDDDVGSTDDEEEGNNLPNTGHGSAQVQYQQKENDHFKLHPNKKQKQPKGLEVIAMTLDPVSPQPRKGGSV